MARNIEIKARVPDAALLRAFIEELETSDTELLFQRDTFYEAPSGRLKLREFSEGAAELIFYERSNKAGPRKSTYTRSVVHDPSSMHELLERLLTIKAVVCKKRQVWIYGQTRIHLDEVEGLGSFLELEVILDDNQSEEDGEQIVAKLMTFLEVQQEALIGQAYVDLLTVAKSGCL